ncbi:hypothetical protein EDD22DRAFT_881652, partial [Suillus occidentalis]
MSTPVQTSLAGLKGSTLKLVGIIAGARLIPAGTGEAHNVLTKQATTLLGEIVREHEKGDYIPGIVASCSKELLRVRPMTPRVWPNWHSIGHDDPRVSKHAWCNKIRAWEVLGDHSCDLSVVPDPSTGPLTVDLPSPAPVPPPAPVIPSAPVLPSPPGISGTSGPQTSEFRDKGKGKAVAVDLALEVEGSRKRKSPMISGHSSQPPKSAMKSRKCAKSTRPVKSAPDVESEDEEDTIVQPISRGVPEVVLPQLSTIVVRTPSCLVRLVLPRSKILGLLQRLPAVVRRFRNLPSVVLRLHKPPAVVRRSSSPLMTLQVLRMGNLLLFPPLILRFLAQTTPAIIVSRKIGTARLVWTGGPATPAYLASGAPPRRSNVIRYLWDLPPNTSEVRPPPSGLVPGPLPLLPPLVRLPRSPGPGLKVNLVGYPELRPSLLRLHPRCSLVVAARPLPGRPLPLPLPLPQLLFRPRVPQCLVLHSMCPCQISIPWQLPLGMV